MKTADNSLIKTDGGGNSKRIISIDILKYISIFFVIAIHFSHAPELVAFSRFAVPTFFILSGYLLHNKNDKKSIIKDIKFYFPYIALLLIIQLFDFILTSQFRDFIGITWFLVSYFLTRFYYYLICNYNLKKVFFYLIPILLAFNLFFGTYSRCFFGDLAIVFSRNSIFVGLPFFLIGVLIRQLNLKLNKEFSIIIILLGIFFLSFQIPEFRLMNSRHDFVGDLYLYTIIGSVLLCVGCINFEINVPSKYIKKLHLDKLNFGIYLYHAMIGILMRPILADNLFLIYLFSAIIFYVISFLVETIKNKMVVQQNL